MNVTTPIGMNGPMSVKWTIAGKEIYIQQCFTLTSILFLRTHLDSTYTLSNWAERILYANCHVYPKPRLCKKMLPNWAIYLYHNPDTDFCFDFHFCQAFLMSFLALISSIHCLIQLNQKSFVKWGKRTWSAEKIFLCHTSFI